MNIIHNELGLIVGLSESMNYPFINAPTYVTYLKYLTFKLDRDRVLKEINNQHESFTQ